MHMITKPEAFYRFQSTTTKETESNTQPFEMHNEQTKSEMNWKQHDKILKIRGLSKSIIAENQIKTANLFVFKIQKPSSDAKNGIIQFTVIMIDKDLPFVPIANSVLS